VTGLWESSAERFDIEIEKLRYYNLFALCKMVDFEKINGLPGESVKKFGRISSLQDSPGH